MSRWAERRWAPQGGIQEGRGEPNVTPGNGGENGMRYGWAAPPRLRLPPTPDPELLAPFQMTNDQFTMTNG